MARWALALAAVTVTAFALGVAVVNRALDAAISIALDARD